MSLPNIPFELDVLLLPSKLLSGFLYGSYLQLESAVKALVEALIECIEVSLRVKVNDS